MQKYADLWRSCRFDEQVATLRSRTLAKGRAMLNIIGCPAAACTLPAEVAHRFVLEAATGPVEHVKTYCLAQHVFLLPVARLYPSVQTPATRVG